eukprot:4674276-Pleurochrysis_carterae.AAC.1
MQTCLLFPWSLVGVQPVRGAVGPKDCKCGKGVRGARREGHRRDREARTGSGGELVLKGQSTPAPRTPPQ